MSAVFMPLAVLLCAGMISASAADSPQIIQYPGIYTISTVSCLIDRTDTLDIGQVSSSPIQELFSRDLSRLALYGLRKGTVWRRFSIINECGEDLYLQVGRGNMRLFIHTGNTEANCSWAELSPSAENEYNQGTHRYLHLPVGSAGTGEYYLRQRPQAMNCEPVVIGTMPQFKSYQSQNAIAQGFYFGLIAFSFIYHIFLFLSIRRPSYLFLALFTASVGLIFAFYSGYISDNTREWPLNMLPILGALSGIWFIFFTISFLRSRITDPVRHLWLMAVAAMFGINILLSIAGFAHIAHQLNYFNVIFALIVTFYIGIEAYRNGFQPAMHYTIALLFFAVTACVAVLRALDIIPDFRFAGNADQIGIVLSLLLLAFAQGKKINDYISMRKEAQDIAMKEYLEKEKLIRFQNNLLETKVNERTRDLEQSIHTLRQQGEELREANEFKDKVLALLSHDLRSPFSSLAGMLALLQEKALNEEEKNSLLSGIRRSLRNAGNLLDEILDWAGSRKAQENILVEIWPHECIEEIFRLFKVQAQDKGVELINAIDPGMLLEGDENILRLVVRNLVSNAIKFTSKDGYVKVGILEDQAEVQITVQDNGVGISAAGMRKIAEQKGHYSTRGTDNEKGTGLGLKLCREFLEKNGGKLEITSKPSQGSTFTARFGCSARYANKEAAYS
jgi:two-component system, sensor histidine kinase LadS